MASAITRRGLAEDREREALADWFADQLARIPSAANDRRAHLRGVA
jgi:chemotaxis protein MotA